MKYIVLHFSNIHIGPKSTLESQIPEQIGKETDNKYEAVENAHHISELTATTLLVGYTNKLQELHDGHIFNVFEVREFDKDPTKYKVVFRSVERKKSDERYHELEIFTA